MYACLRGVELYEGELYGGIGWNWLGFFLILNTVLVLSIKAPYWSCLEITQIHHTRRVAGLWMENHRQWMNKTP